MKKAIVLFSGGIDSTVLLAMAIERQIQCVALSFDYGQRHKIELTSAKAIAEFYQVEHKILQIDPETFKKSSLVENSAMPRNRQLAEMKKGQIPSTYVPARNTLFIAYAVGQAEIYEADEIHFGPNSLDYHAYVDCRPEYIQKYQELIHLATKQALENTPPLLLTPLIYMTKIDIIRKGKELKAPLDLTWSCYDPAPNCNPCGTCDACVIREEALKSS